MEKLRPGTDLNDTIVGNYMKIFQLAFIPQSLKDKSHIFSSFLMEKLIVELCKEENVFEKEMS
jgi:Ulp1 family protease